MITSLDSQCLPARWTRSRRRVRPPDDHRLVAGVVEHRTQVVRHPAVDGDVVHHVVLDRLHRVQRDGRVGHERTARLIGDPLARAEDLAHERDLALDVVLDLRRGLLVGVGDAEAAAHVVGPEIAQLRDRLQRGAERREVEDLRADVEVQAVEVELVGALRPLDRDRGVGRVEPELGVRPAGGDLGMGVGADAGRDAQQDPLAGARAGISRSSRSSSTRLSTTMSPMPASSAICSSASLLALPCRWIFLGSKPALSARCSSPPEATSQASPSSAKSAQDRSGRKRLGGEVDLEVVGALPRRRARKRRARVRRSSSTTM